VRHVLRLFRFFLPLLLCSAPSSAYYNLGAFWKNPCSNVFSSVGTHFGNSSNYGLTDSTTFTPVVGHTLIAIANVGTNASVIQATVTDSLGNTWNGGPPLTGFTSGYTGFTQFWVAQVVTGGSSDTITLTESVSFNSSFEADDFFVLEYSGLASTNVMDGFTSYAPYPTYTTVMAPGAYAVKGGCDLGVAVFGDWGITPAATHLIYPRISDSWWAANVYDNAPPIPAGFTKGNSPNMSITVGTASQTWAASQGFFVAKGAAFTAPSPTKLVFSTAAQALQTWTCAPVGLQLQNASSVATSTENQVNIALSGSTNLQLYADSGCSYPITSTTIWATTNSQTIYVRFTGNSAGVVTATPTGYSAISQTETVSLVPYTWIGGASCNGNWATAACWQGGVAPTSTNFATFDANCTTNCSATLAANASVLGLWLHSTFPSANSVSLSSHTLTIGTSGMRIDNGVLNGNTGALSASGALVLTAGSWLMDTSTTTVNDVAFFDYTGSGGINPGTGTIVFNSNGDTDFGITGGWPSLSTYYNVVLEDSAGGGANVLNGFLSANNLTINSNGSFWSNGNAMGINGNLTINGTYCWGNGNNTTGGSDMIYFSAGANHTITPTPTANFSNCPGQTTAFYGLSMDNSSVASSNTMTFTASSTTSLGSTNLTLKGNTSNQLNLRSSTGGTAWVFKPKSATTFGGYLNIQDSNSPSKALHSGAGSTCGTGNTNWTCP
jgi:hypothetical protein